MVQQKRTQQDIEADNLEAHVALCHERYETLERRLTLIETKVEHIHTDILHGNKSMMKVIVGATGTIIAGLLSTLVVILMKFN